MADYSVFQTQTLSDIEFIRSKVLSGDWIHLTGDINNLNDTLSYVPANGKTFFLFSAYLDRDWETE